MGGYVLLVLEHLLRAQDHHRSDTRLVVTPSEYILYLRLVFEAHL